MMRQGSAISPLSLGEKILVYSWILGSMILCLTYDSVFLTFLSFPPVAKIKHLSDLALAVEKGDYQCMARLDEGVAEYLWNTNKESLQVIATDLKKNNLSYGFVAYNFVVEKKKNYALFENSYDIDLYRGKFFISEDHFKESMVAFRIRKNLSVIDLLNTFIHRIMASGIFLKYKSDRNFWWTRYYFLPEQNDDTDKRKLTLTDLAPAFIFLLFGWIVSFIVFIGEILLNKKNINESMKRKRKRKRKVLSEISV